MRRLTDDRGMAAVTVAIAGTVLIGMVAFAVDVGALYAERRELQSGADAAALGIAQACAEGDAVVCNPVTAEGTADGYADANAHDGAAAVDDVTLDVLGQTVTVEVSTIDAASGDTLLPSYFAGVLGFDGATVGATASAAWGYPSGLPRTLPLIFSDCEWTKFAPSVQPGPPFSGPESVIFFHGKAESCHSSPSGQDMPGGFGWLGTAGDCSASVTVGKWVSIDPGASPPSDCDPPDIESLMHTAVPIPFFDDIDDTGSNATYRVAGFGALYITGFNFGGGYKQPASGAPPCSGSDRCIAGYFTNTTVSMGDIGGEDRGIVIVKLTG